MAEVFGFDASGSAEISMARLPKDPEARRRCVLPDAAAEAVSAARVISTPAPASAPGKISTLPLPSRAATCRWKS